ncbi:TPA: hypothetical protein ACF2SP_002352, partial [Legionella pneumophila]
INYGNRNIITDFIQKKITVFIIFTIGGVRIILVTTLATPRLQVINRCSLDAVKRNQGFHCTALCHI